MPKVINFDKFFCKSKAFGQTLFPEMSILKKQKLVENAKK